MSASYYVRGKTDCESKVIKRVYRRSVVTDLEVAVVSCGVSGRTHQGYDLSLTDGLPDRYQDRGVVRISGMTSVSVIDLDKITISAHPSRVAYDARHGRTYRRAGGVRDVDSVMEPSPARFERGCQRACARPHEPFVRNARNDCRQLLCSLSDDLIHRFFDDRLAQRRTADFLSVDVVDFDFQRFFSVLSGLRRLCLTDVETVVLAVFRRVRNGLRNGDDLRVSDVDQLVCVCNDQRAADLQRFVRNAVDRGKIQHFSATVSPSCTV